MRNRLQLLILTLPLLAPAAIAQQVPTVKLSTPSAAYAEPFTEIAGVRELSDGRVVVADRRERTLQMLDLQRGSAEPIGREGQGPEEYRLPGDVFALPGDSTLVFDIGNTRYLVVTPDGSPAYTFSLAGGRPRPAGAGAPGAASSSGAAAARSGTQSRARTRDGGRAGAAAAGGPMMIGGLRPPAGVDRQGRFYFVSPPFRMGPNGPEGVDSAVVTRLDRGSGRVDTLTRIHVPGAQVSGGEAGANRVRIMVRTGSPFDPRDESAVAPDGRIAVVRHDPFRIEWIAPAGTVTRGPVQPYTPIRITDADRQAVEEARRRMGGMRVSMGPGGTQVTAGAPPADAAIDYSGWPETKPPFIANAARVAPNGHLWLLRTRPADDRVPVYDVYDGAGRLVRRVALPPESRMVGFGARSVYLTRMDENDLQYLERIDVPELLGGR